MSKCGTTKIAQLNLYNELFSPYGHASVCRNSNGSYGFSCNLSMSFAFLLEKQDRIPEWILSDFGFSISNFGSEDRPQTADLQPPKACPERSRREEDSAISDLRSEPLLAFIAGYTDAEGSFEVTKKGKGARFSLESYDVGLLWQMREIFNDCLDVFCPPVYLHRPQGSPIKGRNGKVYYTNEDMWRLGVYSKASLHRLCGLLEPYLKHADRLQDMYAVWANVKVRGV